jgi:hypothetical protein
MNWTTCCKIGKKIAANTTGRGNKQTRFFCAVACVLCLPISELFSSSTKNLRTCNHRHERGGNGEWILVERGGAAKGKWIARVYIRANTGKLECADCASEKQLARQRKREMDGTKRKRRRTGRDDEVMALKRVHIGHGNQ